MKSNKLTIKQEAFCQAFIRLGDKSAAYREAYSASKMKAEVIHVKANELSNVGKVSVRIASLQKQVADIAEKKFEITHAKMLKKLDIYASACIDEYVEYVEFDFPVYTTTTTGKGKDAVTTSSTSIERRTEIRFKTFDKLTKEQLMCIESIKQNRYGEIELKLHGKDWTIKEINKHIGFYEVDNKQKNPIVPGTKEDITTRIQELLEKRNKKE